MSILPNVWWSVDGNPLRIADWDCNSVTGGGFDQMRGNVALADWNSLPVRPQQGSTVQAFQDNGGTVWYGRISATPQVLQGVVKLAAQGEKVRVEKAASRLLYQSRDYGLWVQGDSDPHAYANADEFSVDAQSARIRFDVGAGTQVNQNEQCQALAWFQVPITRIAFDVTRGTLAVGGYIMRIQTAVGPTGTRTNRGADITGTATFSVDRTTGSGSDDQIDIQLVRDGVSGQTGTGGAHWAIRNLRVNGRISGDSALASDVTADVGGVVGYDVSGVATTATNILPLDWNQGSWAELLDYVWMLEDGWWRVEEPVSGAPALRTGRWSDSREWIVSQAQGAVPDLVPLELFNQVTVRYPTQSGRPGEVTVSADPDPLAGTGITNVFEEELTDVQPSSAFPKNVAGTLMARYSVQRYAGSVDVVQAMDANQSGTVFDIRGGDLLTITDFDQATSQTLRIQEAQYTPGGVRLGIEWPVSAQALVTLTNLARQRRRRRHRR